MLLESFAYRASRFIGSEESFTGCGEEASRSNYVTCHDLENSLAVVVARNFRTVWGTPHEPETQVSITDLPNTGP